MHNFYLIKHSITMNKFFPSSCLLLFFLFLSISSRAQTLDIQYLSTYATGQFDKGAAEIVAYDADSKQLFFTNAQENTLVILNIADPAHPTQVRSINMDAFGGSINSVAVANGLVAAAVENSDKVQPGQVLLFNTSGDFLQAYPAGALPDMVAFSPDGTKILAANEGEPDDDYVNDPEGSVTLIDIQGGYSNAVVKQINFQSFNDKKASLTNRGIRMFGPNASVAQDLEPEYITVTPDNRRAYVTLQENNAVAVIDLNSGNLLDILPLGYKDHWRGAPVLQEFRLNEIQGWPDLGRPVYGGDMVKLGGFSGLCYDPISSTADQLSFWTVPDRGPNEEPISGVSGAAGVLRPYKLPNYQARLVKLNYIKSQDRVYVDANQIFLTQKDGVTPISGKGNVPGFDEIPVTRTDANIYTHADYTVNGVNYHQLPFDPYGGDFEGVIRDRSGNFWLCDENRPSIYQFNPNGVLIERYVPQGTSQLGTDPKPANFYGKETLPAVYSKRWDNRGFEAIAYDPDEDIIYAFIQSPMDNPNSTAVRNKSDVIRILGINPATGQPVKEFVYLLERNKYGGFGLNRVDKIGDAVYIGHGIFLVFERDSSVPANGNTGKKYIFEINTRTATNILGMALSQKASSSGPDDKTLEMMSAEDLAAAGIRPVHKNKLLNLPSIGYLPSDKAEGLALIPGGELVVLNDNDFGLAGAGISDISSFGKIGFKFNYGFDASDRSPGIQMQPRQTLGMYLPDAIASYQVNGKNYFLTANEGDSRDYDGFSEETRVGSLRLDATAFPWPTFLQNNNDLGRLKTSTADGDYDGDGDVDAIYSFGARSFSIWDEFGNQVYDSGSDFEIFTSIALPDFFNSEGDDSKKSRSDDKGPEPEGITVAQISGQTYAFVALERIGGFMVYNVTNPFYPYFVKYVYNRNFSLSPEDDVNGDVAPECIIVIDADKSPSGNTLVVTSSEVSGTVSIFNVNNVPFKPAPSKGNGNFSSGDDKPADVITMMRAYPNPFENQVALAFHTAAEADLEWSLSDAFGRTVRSGARAKFEAGFHQLQISQLNNLPSGNYFLRIVSEEQNQVLSLVKK